jgi:hypothetical protein
MYKISISGKANTGKNTVGKLLVQEIKCHWSPNRFSHQFIAFADPLKKMARLAFPQIPRKWLYGSSKFRSEIIPGAFKEGVPLTVRQLLIDLGSDFGRKYQADIWLRNFDNIFNKLVKKDVPVVIVTDCRFRNEFDHLKDLGFFQIRIIRDHIAKINDTSETNQDGILDSEFDVIIDNNKDKAHLKKQVQQVLPLLHE